MGYQLQHTPHIADAIGDEFPGLLRDLAAWQDIDRDSVVSALATVAQGS